MTALDKRLRDMLDKDEIYEVLVRYCRGVDRGDVDMIRSVYHDDAIDDHGIFKGRGYDFAQWIVDMLQDCGPCMHLVGNVMIELDGDVAYSEAYCLSVSDYDGKTQNTVYNRYVDRFERRNGEWKIAHRTVVFDMSRLDPLTEPYGKDMQHAFTFGRRDRQDPVYRR